MLIKKNRWIGTGRRRTILNDLGECWGKAPCLYIFHPDTPHSKCWLKPEKCVLDGCVVRWSTVSGKIIVFKVVFSTEDEVAMGPSLRLPGRGPCLLLKAQGHLTNCVPWAWKSVPESVCSWGEVPLPDSSDGSLQGGDHVFNEEVIPIAPVFCHGIACPSICEGDIYVNFIGHK